MRDKGFTMIELVLVIAILGILAVTALPKFFNLTTNARDASRDGVVGAVRAGIALVRANNTINNVTPVIPATLDVQADGACTTCFSSVLDNAISDTHWTKAGLVYSYNDGTNTVNYTYTPATGLFQ